MDLQKFMALGAVQIIYTKNGNPADDTAVKALKYSDQIPSAVAIVDPDAELILLGYQASMDTAGNFFLENASGGTGASSDAKTVLPKQYLATNGTTQLVDCYLPFGKGDPIMVGGTNPGNLSLVLYVMDKAYVNRRRWPFNT